MSHFGYNHAIAAAAVLCLLPAAVVAQRTPASAQAKAAASAPTPRAPDGHPDLSGLWNAWGDGLNGIPNQLANAGIEVGTDASRDISSGAQVATFPTPFHAEDAAVSERASSLLRRMGSNRPLYKPEYWETVKKLDQNANEEDPSAHCMPAGVPRLGVPAQILQTPTLLVFLYRGEGGLIATPATYRIIPTDGRQHTNLEDLDGTWNGESIGHWEGDTMVIDTIGFNSSSWIDQVGGYFHSENMRVIEHVRRDGNTLTWQATVEDPDVLLQPWTITPRTALLNPNPKAVLPESLPCSERDFAHVVTKEHH